MLVVMDQNPRQFEQLCRQVRSIVDICHPAEKNFGASRAEER